VNNYTCCTNQLCDHGAEWDKRRTFWLCSHLEQIIVWFS